MRFTGTRSSAFFTKVVRSVAREDGRNSLGRVLSLCYAHAIESDVSLSQAILKWDLQSKNVAINIVDEYFIKNRSRRADFSVLGDAGLLAHVEVKVDDKLHKNQLRDYLRDARDKRAKFFIITRDPLTTDENRMLIENGGTHIRHFEVCDRLRQVNTPTASMIASYLEDLGMGGYVPIRASENTLKYLARRFLPTNYQTGFGRQQSSSQADELPQVLSVLLNNARVAGDWLSETGLFSQRFQTFPYVHSYWNLDAIRKTSRLLKGVGSIDDKYGQGGCLYFLALGKFRKSKVTQDGYVELGFFVNWDKAESEFSTGCYVNFTGPAFPDVEDDWLWYKDAELPLDADERKVRDCFRKMIEKIAGNRSKELSKARMDVFTALARALK